MIICRVSFYIHIKFNRFLFICYIIMTKIKFKTENMHAENVAVDHRVTSFLEWRHKKWRHFAWRHYIIELITLINYKILFLSWVKISILYVETCRRYLTICITYWLTLVLVKKKLIGKNVPLNFQFKLRSMLDTTCKLYWKYILYT